MNASSGDEDLKNTDATALPSVVRDAVLAWAAGTRVSARPAEAEWHDAVAADLKHQALSWRHALVLAERERREQRAQSGAESWRAGKDWPWLPFCGGWPWLPCSAASG